MPKFKISPMRRLGRQNEKKNIRCCVGLATQKPTHKLINKEKASMRQRPTHKGMKKAIYFVF